MVSQNGRIAEYTVKASSTRTYRNSDVAFLRGERIVARFFDVLHFVEIDEELGEHSS